MHRGVDGAGQPGSDPYDGPRTIAQELAAVRAVDAGMEAGGQRMDVFGRSLGAAVAAQWAADHLEAVERLVLYGGWADGARLGDADSRTHVLGPLPQMLSPPVSCRVVASPPSPNCQPATAGMSSPCSYA